MRYLIIAILLMPITVLAQTYEEDAAAIAAQNKIYMQGYNERNAEMVVSVHSEDAVVYAPNRPLYRGRTGVQQMVEEDFALFKKYDLQLVTVDLEVHADTAIDVGTYKAKLTDNGDTEIVDEGHFIVIWKRQANGTWLYETDMFNSRAPLP